ncbi:MAG: TIR domain-containing protein [Alphaproteobacteria bacterium]|nr:TIR domain-containing protein [Alphaproteobacteria bacterium]
MDKTSKYIAFISYSRKDLEIATQIKNEIERVCGAKCWMDMEGIESGDQFEDIIISAIENSKVTIFLMSKNSMASTYSKKEVRYADSVNKKVVPVNIDGSESTGWFLFNFGGIDIIDYNNVEQKKKFYSNMEEWGKNMKKDYHKDFPVIFADKYSSRPILHLFLLIDTSDSMYGKRIEAINDAFSNVLSSFEIINPDIEIKVAALEYNTSVRWFYDCPMPLEEFHWPVLEAGGLTSTGEALKSLNDKMTSSEYFSYELCPGGILPSLIILLTDGEPTDNYKMEMKQLLVNPYFKKSTKFAIGMGYDFALQPLVDFTGNEKKVFQFGDERPIEEFHALLTRLLTMGLYAGSVSALGDE